MDIHVKMLFSTV